MPRNVEMGSTSSFGSNFWPERRQHKLTTPWSRIVKTRQTPVRPFRLKIPPHATYLWWKIRLALLRASMMLKFHLVTMNRRRHVRITTIHSVDRSQVWLVPWMWTPRAIKVRRGTQSIPISRTGNSQVFPNSRCKHFLAIMGSVLSNSALTMPKCRYSSSTRWKIPLSNSSSTSARHPCLSILSRRRYDTITTRRLESSRTNRRWIVWSLCRSCTSTALRTWEMDQRRSLIHQRTSTPIDNRLWLWCSKDASLTKRGSRAHFLPCNPSPRSHLTDSISSSSQQYWRRVCSWDKKFLAPVRKKWITANTLRLTQRTPLQLPLVVHAKPSIEGLSQPVAIALSSQPARTFAQTIQIRTLCAIKQSLKQTHQSQRPSQKRL